ncbi:MAG TPA: DUF4344 domain-containing metallopeptidase [Conexibacter sp.]|nr:DUF4344 domain-containing metallopeptidase [Conexibacter sp.]
MLTPRRLICATLLAAVASLGTAAVAPADEILGDGRVVVEWGPAARAAKPFAASLRRSGSIEQVATAVNDRYRLPRDIPVVFSSEAEIGPAYLPEVEIEGDKVSFIHFPHTFLTYEVKVMRKMLGGMKDPGPVRMMIYANEFVVAHELGHALVDQLAIPITGKEEDAVDGFAAYLLANTPAFGPRSALAASILFAGMSSTPTEEDYADEHSLSQQRTYQFLCWIYGSDPKEFKSLVGRDGLPKRRAVRCGDEWKQLNRSWSTLMAPHLKTPVA